MIKLAFIRFLPETETTSKMIYKPIFGEEIKEIIINYKYDLLQSSLWKFNQGAKIQDAFNYFSVEERELFLTGLDDEEYDEICKEED